MKNAIWLKATNKSSYGLSSRMEDFYYLFDMDGTLFFTDELNNESYNSALADHNFKPIHNMKRITRKIVKGFYPELTKGEITGLINRKQDYFIENIRRIQENNFLFAILKRLEKEKCILWTSAERRRVDGIIREFSLQRFFDKVILSGKQCISDDIHSICLELSCTRDQLLVFENDVSVVKKLEGHHVSCLLFIRA